MKTHLLAIIFTCIASFASADVYEAWDFQLIDGDATKNIALFDSAKAIQEKLGAHIEYWQHDVNGANVIAYVLRFNNQTEWAAYKDAASNNSEWLAWIAENWPKLQPFLVTSYAMGNLFNADAGTDISEGKTVAYMSAWEPTDNSNNLALAASIQSSIAISAAHGIESNVYLNGPSGIFYIFQMDATFSDLTEKFQKRNASEAWQAYWTEAQTARVGQFVRQAWITRVAE